VAGVVLTGTLNDNTVGLSTIKHRGAFRGAGAEDEGQADLIHQALSSGTPDATEDVV
jgi:chemotaxis response regulator CheB